MGGREVEAFLNHLAIKRQCSAPTQAQALNALGFLYQEVLGKELGNLKGLKRVQQRHRVPVVLSVDEVKSCLGFMSGTPQLAASIGRITPYMNSQLFVVHYKPFFPRRFDQPVTHFKSTHCFHDWLAGSLNDI